MAKIVELRAAKRGKPTSAQLWAQLREASRINDSSVASAMGICESLTDHITKVQQTLDVLDEVRWAGLDWSEDFVGGIEAMRSRLASELARLMRVKSILESVSEKISVMDRTLNGLGETAVDERFA